MALIFGRDGRHCFLYEIFLSFKDTSESKNIDFSFEPSQPAYKMFIDKGNLDKVTYNLLSNAFKYTPSNGKIIFKIDIQEDKQQLRIQVIDNGIGIPKENVLNCSSVSCKAASLIAVSE